MTTPPSDALDLLTPSNHEMTVVGGWGRRKSAEREVAQLMKMLVLHSCPGSALCSAELSARVYPSLVAQLQQRLALAHAFAPSSFAAERLVEWATALPCHGALAVLRNLCRAPEVVDVACTQPGFAGQLVDTLVATARCDHTFPHALKLVRVVFWAPSGRRALAAEDSVLALLANAGTRQARRRARELEVLEDLGWATRNLIAGFAPAAVGVDARDGAGFPPLEVASCVLAALLARLPPPHEGMEEPALHAHVAAAYLVQQLSLLLRGALAAGDGGAAVVRLLALLGRLRRPPALPLVVACAVCNVASTPEGAAAMAIAPIAGMLEAMRACPLTLPDAKEAAAVALARVGPAAAAGGGVPTPFLYVLTPPIPRRHGAPAAEEMSRHSVPLVTRWGDAPAGGGGGAATT